MTCDEFLERYSEFRDGLVTAPRERRRFERHLARCPACRRHDAALRRGVRALQDAAPLAPSPEFRRRLEARLAAERRRARAGPAGAGVAAALMVAAALALVAVEAGRRPAAVPPPALPPVPFPQPVVQAGVPLVAFQDPRAGVFAGTPGPHAAPAVEPASAGR
jgi:anti-sigma factor RsiW